MKVDEGESYTLGEIVRLRFLPGVDTIPKAARLVNKPFPKLKGQVVPMGAAIRYKVTGRAILDYLKKYGKDTGNNS